MESSAHDHNKVNKDDMQIYCKLRSTCQDAYNLRLLPRPCYNFFVYEIVSAQLHLNSSDNIMTWTTPPHILRNPTHKTGRVTINLLGCDILN